MRLALKTFATLVALFALTLTPTTASASTADPFVGAWESYDAGDGSYQILNVRGSGTGGMHGVRFVDTVASEACAGGPAGVQGSGSVSGRRMTFSFTISCPGFGKGPTTGLVGPIVFTYHPGSDTLTDGSGTVWSRLT